MQKETAPIALFVYNRLNHTKRVLEALAKNSLAKESKLYVFSDGPKLNPVDIEKVNQVRNLLYHQNHFEHFIVIERKENLGLSENILTGIQTVFKHYPRIIVLEDDTLPAPCFLNYMNEALDMYENQLEVGTIQGFQFPINLNKLGNNYFDYPVGCWGWATWNNRWAHFQPDGKWLWDQIKKHNLSNKFNLNRSYPFMELLEQQWKGEVDSWAIRWYASLFLLNKLNYYPARSMVQNIGTDGSGTHPDKNNYNGLTLPHFHPVEYMAVKQNSLVSNKVISFRKGILRTQKRKNLIRKIRINLFGLNQ